jgi:DNA-binding NtrC family response regulator
MTIRPKVLVVDDDWNILSVFEDFLKKEHCILIPAANSKEAAIYLENERIDLLIMNVDFKKKSELTLFKRAKGLQTNLPVIIMTSYTDIIEEKDAMDYGANYFLPKPLDLNKLRGAVRKCLKLENSA